MFSKLNEQFGCKTQPNSMLMATNTESGWVVKPKLGFMSMNIEFGCLCGVQGRDSATQFLERRGATR